MTGRRPPTGHEGDTETIPTTTSRRVEHRELDTLKPNPDNAKLHEIAGIGQSMTRFGLVDVIVMDDRTGFIVSGHGRVDSLRELRDTGKPPPDRGGVEVRDGAWWVPVVTGWASRNDDEAAAATVALNRWTERGGWDVGRLIDRLDHLADTGPYGLIGVGFDQPDIDDLLAQHQETMRLAEQDDDDWTPGDPDRQVRALNFDYPLDDYRWLAATMLRARDAYNVDSNAALFLVMLEEDAER